ncbi:replication initiation protein [Eubacteriales bacterium OttesenSCG-928-A19]|nr:replication initiation protein [Eubacteriales bacterium OttesenSCG-928-A19]
MSPRKKPPTAAAHLRAVETVTPALIPNVETPSRFRPMLQGTGTNRLTQVSSRSASPEIDAVTGLATITADSLTVFIESYNSLTGGLRVSTHKLLDACTIVLTSQNHYRGDGPMNTLVSIPLDDYMHQCGVPMTKASKDKTRRKVKEDLEALYSTSIEWSESAGNEGTRDYAKMRIISMHAIRGGNIVVRFSEDMARYLTHSYVMQYPMELFRLDERNPSAYYMGKKLLLHNSIENNRRRRTANLLSVKALLSSTPDIPSYEEVMRGDRHLERRIIQPFENALSALDGTVRWEYTNARGIPLTRRQLDDFHYDVFIRCYVRFEVARDDPDEEEDG